ncbi:hypothetical protein [Acinetobacter terrestris]|uniref:hypothetical protein n=1 Tax=Acinetobacter terrestris TaxID=2529843 RepID=UPI0026A3F92F
MYPLKYRRANTADIEHLVILINQAYRTNTGSSWTSEQNIVAGDRISHQQLLESFKQITSLYLLLRFRQISNLM